MFMHNQPASTVIVDSLAMALARIKMQEIASTLTEERSASVTTDGCSPCDSSYFSDSTSSFGDSLYSNDRCSPPFLPPHFNARTQFHTEKSFGKNACFPHSRQCSSVAQTTDYDDDFCFVRRRRTPADNYICHICYGKGHYIRDCPKSREADSDTPYQGPKQCFGMFKCPKCKRKWTSSNSFAQIQQECKKCLIGTFPYKQMKLEFAIQQNLYKPHHRNNVEDVFTGKKFRFS